MRWLISRRSYSEPEMIMLAANPPAGVLVSRSRSAKWSAPAFASGRSTRPAPSTHRTTQPVHLGHQQSSGLLGAHRFQGGQSGRAPFRDFRADVRVAVLVHDRRPLSLGVCGDSRALASSPRPDSAYWEVDTPQIGDRRFLGEASALHGGDEPARPLHTSRSHHTSHAASFGVNGRDVADRAPRILVNRAVAERESVVLPVDLRGFSGSIRIWIMTWRPSLKVFQAEVAGYAAARG